VIETIARIRLDYIEKPTFDYQVAWRCTFEPAVLATRPRSTGPTDQDVMCQAQSASYPFSRYWLDMGRPDMRAIGEFESRRAEFLPTEAK
jgi:hypothetical protein